MRQALTLLASLLVLASCSKTDEPKQSAFSQPTNTPTTSGLMAPSNPDVDPARSVFFRECRQLYSVEICTCTANAVKSTVDAESYKTLRTMGMAAIMAFDSAQRASVRTQLTKAYDSCGAKAADEAEPSPVPTPSASPSASPTKG